jgi:hypothetical protein
MALQEGIRFLERRMRAGIVMHCERVRGRREPRYSLAGLIRPTAYQNGRCRMHGRNSPGARQWSFDVRAPKNGMVRGDVPTAEWPLRPFSQGYLTMLFSCCSQRPALQRPHRNVGGPDEPRLPVDVITPIDQAQHRGPVGSRQTLKSP